MAPIINFDNSRRLYNNYSVRSTKLNDQFISIAITIVFLIAIAGTIYLFSLFRKRRYTACMLFLCFLGMAIGATKLLSPDVVNSQTNKLPIPNESRIDPPQTVVLAASDPKVEIQHEKNPTDTVDNSLSENRKPINKKQANVVTKFWVTAYRLNRRTCPSTSCGIVGQLSFNEGIEVFEQSNGWVRISKYYFASCVEGQSEYINTGNNNCTSRNGIVEGKLAEWVSVKFLSEDQPRDPKT